MTRRLVLSYLGLAFLILLVLEIPLAVLAGRHEQDLTASQVEREASGLAAVTSEDVENNQIADLNAILARYHARTGGEIFVVGPAGQVVAHSAGDSDNDATGENRGLVQAALSGRSATSFASDEGQPWAAAAVPLSADGRSAGRPPPRSGRLVDRASGSRDLVGPGRVGGRRAGPHRPGRPAPRPFSLPAARPPRGRGEPARAGPPLGPSPHR